MEKNHWTIETLYLCVFLFKEPCIVVTDRFKRLSLSPPAGSNRMLHPFKDLCKVIKYYYSILHLSYNFTSTLHYYQCYYLGILSLLSFLIPLLLLLYICNLSKHLQTEEDMKQTTLNLFRSIQDCWIWCIF